MGLDISIGDIVQVRQDDPECLDELLQEFDRLQAALTAAGVEGYLEPHDLPDEALLCSRVGPYGTYIASGGSPLTCGIRESCLIRLTTMPPKTRSSSAVTSILGIAAAARVSTTCSSTATARATTSRWISSASWRLKIGSRSRGVSSALRSDF
jgi:hypothetical protein